MATLNPNLVLKRVPDVEVRINSDNNIQLVSDETVYYLGPHGLAVLDVFYQPVSVSEALKKLSAAATGLQDWMALTDTVVQLYDAGILQDESQRRRTLKTSRRGFGGPGIHVSMLNDRARTSSFLDGIAEVVREGDIVVDIGTGTGVLAVAAARAGAKHVYAIEASAIGEVAEAIFEDNGLADRITLLRGWSTRLDLPERADVLVSEIIGNEPLGESVLEVTRDARKRLLKPEARLVPSRVRVFGLPVVVPDTELSKRVLMEDTLENWRSWYGMDFGSLADTDGGSPRSFLIKPQDARGWNTLGEPILLAEADLSRVERPMIERSVACTANASGVLNGLLAYFELDLGPTTRLSTHPVRAGEDCSWFSVVWLLDPLPVRTADRLKVTYKYRAMGSSHRVAVDRA
jgi:protein arginine N-methyltransferase 1